MSVHFSSDTDNWATPDWLFDALDAFYKFDIDVCASKDNAKCDTFFTKEDDGLSKEWRGVVWMNPPYGREIGKWVNKARESAEENGATVVCLVPARVDTAWWQDNVPHAHEVHFIRGRLKFGDAKNSAPFPSAVIVFRKKIIDLIGR